MKIKILILSIFASLMFQMGVSQSIIGTWKKTASIIINADGTEKDMQKMLTKALPCTAEVKYIFESNGKQYIQAPKNCLPTIATEVVNWSIKGDEITLISKATEVITGELTKYTLNFKDGFVDFTHIYTPDEKTKWHNKAKKVVITYKRV